MDNPLPLIQTHRGNVQQNGTFIRSRQIPPILPIDHAAATRPVPVYDAFPSATVRRTVRALAAVGLAAVAVLIVLAFGAWLVWPAIEAVSDAATSRAMCPGLTPDECAAYRAGGL